MGGPGTRPPFRPTVSAATLTLTYAQPELVRRHGSSPWRRRLRIETSTPGSSPTRSGTTSITHRRRRWVPERSQRLWWVACPALAPATAWAPLPRPVEPVLGWRGRSAVVGLDDLAVNPAASAVTVLLVRCGRAAVAAIKASKQIEDTGDRAELSLRGYAVGCCHSCGKRQWPRGAVLMKPGPEPPDIIASHLRGLPTANHVADRRPSWRMMIKPMGHATVVFSRRLTAMA